LENAPTKENLKFVVSELGSASDLLNSGEALNTLRYLAMLMPSLSLFACRKKGIANERPLWCEHMFKLFVNVT
jgi:hypothetical protein